MLISASVYNIVDMYPYHTPVICMPRRIGAGDTGDIAGLKCWELTCDPCSGVDVLGF